MVGETKWQHGMATFCKPFTRAKVQYFDHARATECGEVGWTMMVMGDVRC